MLTQTFKERIALTLHRIDGVSTEQAATLAEMGYDDTKKLCRLMMYNETVDPALQSDKQKKAILDNDCSAFDDDSLWKEIYTCGNARFNLYDGFTKRFATNPSGASIIRIGRELRMSVEDINSILTSYGLQTISFHRVDDLLFRYVEAKGWSYHRFVLEEKYKEKGESQGLPSVVVTDDHWDSALATRLNSLRLKQMCDSSEAWTEHPYPMICKMFLESERNASGAPRRTMMKLLSMLSTDYIKSYYSNRVHSAKHDAPCRPLRLSSAFSMLHEAAVVNLPDFSSAQQRKIVACVTRVIDMIFVIVYKPLGRIIPSTEGIHQLPDSEYALNLIISTVKREILKRIADEEERKLFSCDVGYILNALSQGEKLYDSEIRNMDDRETFIRCQIVQNALFRLLIACDEGNVRKYIEGQIEYEILPTFPNLVSQLSQKKITSEMGKVMRLKRQEERNSEPNRSFLIVLALYTYGFSFAMPTSGYNSDSIKSFISQILNGSGYLPLGSDVFDKVVVNLVDKISSHVAFSCRPVQRRENWCQTVKTAWEHNVKQYRAADMKQICARALISRHWSYNELPKRSNKQKDVLNTPGQDKTR